MVDDFGHVTGEFNKFVKPIVNPVLSHFCRKLTSISQNDVNRASKYDRVIEEFREWGDMYDENFLFISWGDFDIEILRNNCQLHKKDDDWLYGNHVDLKMAYKRMLDLRHPIGLKKAVKNEGFEFTGLHHRGISDAQNLAKVFAKYIDEWGF